MCSNLYKKVENVRLMLPAITYAVHLSHYRVGRLAATPK